MKYLTMPQDNGQWSSTRDPPAFIKKELVALGSDFKPKPRGREGRGDSLAESFITGVLNRVEKRAEPSRHQRHRNVSSPITAETPPRHSRYDESPLLSRKTRTIFDETIRYPTVDEFFTTLQRRKSLPELPWAEIGQGFTKEGLTHFNHLAAIPSQSLKEVCGVSLGISLVLASVIKEEMQKYVR